MTSGVMGGSPDTSQNGFFFFLAGGADWAGAFAGASTTGVSAVAVSTTGASAAGSSFIHGKRFSTIGAAGLARCWGVAGGLQPRDSPRPFEIGAADRAGGHGVLHQLVVLFGPAELADPAAHRDQVLGGAGHGAEGGGAGHALAAVHQVLVLLGRTSIHVFAQR